MKIVYILAGIVVAITITAAAFLFGRSTPPITPHAEGPSIRLPDEVKGETGDFVVIRSLTNGNTVKWVSFDRNLRVFPSELLKDTKNAIVMANRDGQYRVLAYTALGDQPSEPAITVLKIGKAPDPGPTPPDPGPTPTPTPTPSPIPAPGFRVLMVYESADLQKLPAAQVNILYAKSVRDYLNEKCVKDADNPSGAYRIWDKDVVTTNESKLWQDAMRRERKTLPWIIISTGNGGFEGALPANVDDTLTLMKKYGAN